METEKGSPAITRLPTQAASKAVAQLQNYINVVP